MASAEVALRFKVGPLNETKNFCLNNIFVGLHLLAGHRFEVRRFAKECVRANLCAPPNLFPREAYTYACRPLVDTPTRTAGAKPLATCVTSRGPLGLFATRPSYEPPRVGRRLQVRIQAPCAAVGRS